MNKLSHNTHLRVHACMRMCVSVHVCVRACARARVLACVRVCAFVCLRVDVFECDRLRLCVSNYIQAVKQPFHRKLYSSDHRTPLYVQNAMSLLQSQPRVAYHDHDRNGAVTPRTNHILVSHHSCANWMRSASWQIRCVFTRT